MAFAIFVSLIVSFSLTPMLSARLAPAAAPQGHGVPEAAPRTDGRRLLQADRARLHGAPPLRRCGTAGSSCVLACGTLGSCVPLFAAVPKGFTPPNDVAEFDVNMRAPEGTSLLETRLIAERLAREVRDAAGRRRTRS